MSTDTIREILETEIQTKYPVLQPGVFMVFANTRFEPPEPAIPWIHVAVLPSIDHRASIGTDTEFQSLGVVNVTCMVAEHTGTKSVRQLADSVAVVLMDRQIPIPGGGHITTYAVDYRERGVINGWYSVNVIVSYRARIRVLR